MAKQNIKKDSIIIKNIYKKNEQDKNIQEILIKSYKIFINKEWKEGIKCLNF